MEGITEGVMRSDFFFQDSARCRMVDTADRRQGLQGDPPARRLQRAGEGSSSKGSGNQKPRPQGNLRLEMLRWGH